MKPHRAPSVAMVRSRLELPHHALRRGLLEGSPGHAGRSHKLETVQSVEVGARSGLGSSKKAGPGEC